MDQRTYQSEDQIREAVRQAVINDPRSEGLRSQIPYFAVSHTLPPADPGSWKVDVAPTAYPPELTGPLHDAVVKVQASMLLHPRWLGQSCHA